MKKDFLLFLGTGILVGSALLGIVVGLVHLHRAKVQEFKFGVFYSVFALVASIGYCFAAIAFYYTFVGGQVAAFSGAITLAVVVGLVITAIYVRKDSRVLFAIMSFYTLLTLWLAPVFLWNIIYLLFVARRSRPKEAALPPA